MTSSVKAIALRQDQMRWKTLWAAAALALVLVALPAIGHAQGIIGGAERGSREGHRAAGPIGGVVGGAIGAGVGGVVGGVRGVVGAPQRGYRHHGRYSRHYGCRGYYTSSGRFRCYR